MHSFHLGTWTRLKPTAQVLGEHAQSLTLGYHVFSSNILWYHFTGASIPVDSSCMVGHMESVVSLYPLAFYVLMLETKGQLIRNLMSESPLKLCLIPRGTLCIPAWICWIIQQIWHDSQSLVLFPLTWISTNPGFSPVRLSFFFSLPMKHPTADPTWFPVQPCRSGGLFPIWFVKSQIHTVSQQSQSQQGCDISWNIVCNFFLCFCYSNKVYFYYRLHHLHF